MELGKRVEVEEGTESLVSDGDSPGTAGATRSEPEQQKRSRTARPREGTQQGAEVQTCSVLASRLAGRRANIGVSQRAKEKISRHPRKRVFVVVVRVAQEQKRRFDIRGRMAAPVGRMSGGNQQKVLISKWLVEKPKVFIIDEPTRGVDVGAKMAIYGIIRELAASGVAVIVVSSEMEEVLGLSHRVLVMSGGRQRGILTRDEATPERVMALAVSA